MSSVYGVGSGASPQAMTGASARQPLAQQYNNMFSQLTTPGSGVVTRDQFTQAFSSLNPPSSFQSMGARLPYSRRLIQAIPVRSRVKILSRVSRRFRPNLLFRGHRALKEMRQDSGIWSALPSSRPARST